MNVFEELFRTKCLRTAKINAIFRDFCCRLTPIGGRDGERNRGREGEGCERGREERGGGRERGGREREGGTEGDRERRK